MSRLINADALIECRFKNDISYNAFCKLIKRQETIDAVPVIRCVECRFYRETKGINGVTMTECGVNDGFYDKPGWVWTEPNGYCHKAKRKRVENDVF